MTAFAPKRTLEPLFIFSYWVSNSSVVVERKLTTRVKDRTIRHSLYLLGLAIFCFSLASCATGPVKLYKENELPREEVAILKHGIGLAILSVHDAKDGARLKEQNPDEWHENRSMGYAVKPGRYRISVYHAKGGECFYQSSSGILGLLMHVKDAICLTSSGRSFCSVFELTVRPGRTYKVSYQTHARVNVIDADDGSLKASQGITVIGDEGDLAFQKSCISKAARARGSSDSKAK